MTLQAKPIQVLGIPLVLVLAGLGVTVHLGRAQTGGLTSLLVPFATNQAGFDTLFEIANTTMDPYGTPTVSGSCTFNFFGVNAPAPHITKAIAPGTVQHFTASKLAPNFQGYVIVNCNFPLAHAWYAVKKPGSTLFGESEALVLPVPRSAPESLKQ